MAKEVSVTLSLRWARQGVAIQASTTDNYDQVGVEAIEVVQKVGTTSEPLNLGDVTDPAYVFFKNLDSAHDIHVGSVDPTTDANATVHLKPGKGIFLTSQQTGWFAVADGAESDLLAIFIQR